MLEKPVVYHVSTMLSSSTRSVVAYHARIHSLEVSGSIPGEFMGCCSVVFFKGGRGKWAKKRVRANGVKL